MSLATDTNMVPGQSYTFTFSLGNWFSQPSVATLQSDLLNWGPQYAQSVVVNWQSGFGQLSSYNPFANYLLVTFTYKGDGSDVVADAGQEFVQAFTQGSNDNFTFSGADSGYQSGSGGTAAPPTDSGCGVTNLSACLPNSNLLVVGIIIVVFGLVFLSPAGQSIATRRSA